MYIKDLSGYWQKKIETYVLQKSNNKATHVSSEWCDFSKNVTVIFSDGSKCNFFSALFLKSDDCKEICVLTEHAGDFVFDARAIKIYQYEKKFFRKKIHKEHIGIYFDDSFIILV